LQQYLIVYNPQPIMTSDSVRDKLNFPQSGSCMRKSLSLLGLAMTIFAGRAGAQVITASIDATTMGAPISPLIYGMFVEHIGALLEQGFRAEMLDDRKFFFAVGQQPPSNARGNRGGPRRGWQLLAADGSVTMDTTHAYASAHVPHVTLAGPEVRGIRQGGVAIKAGKEYTGRIVIGGEPGALVSVSLVWGEGAAARQTVRLPALTDKWTTRPFHFAALPANTDSARFEVTGTGRGSFRVGAVSLMPADNVRGFRREIVSALATMHSGVYRFPGGNFVSGPFDWRDAIGDPDKRPPRWDPVWSALQPNDFGLDEFMELCQLLDVQPYITVNAGFGDAISAAQQVEYANGAATTPMGRLRAANGHPKPYGIRYWGIGNEMWGDWQYGYMSLDQWIAKQGQFAREMRTADPTITLVAAGAMPDAMTGSGMAKKLTGKVVAEEMGPADWSAALLARSINDFELLSQHFYVYAGTHYDLEQGKQVPDDPNIPLVEWARKPANMVRAESENFQTYLERIPAVRQKHITVALDEWAYSGTAPGAYKPVLAYAWGLNELFRHSDVFTMGGFTFAGSTLAHGRGAEPDRIDVRVIQPALRPHSTRRHRQLAAARAHGTRRCRNAQRERRQPDVSARRGGSAVRGWEDADGVSGESERERAEPPARPAWRRGIGAWARLAHGTAERDVGNRGWT
jgi:alpha-N-arabinofuranosidase